MSNIVPFGKYKGQPAETLLADDQYKTWLLEQPWFKEKYQNIYLTVINYSAEPTDTPEHNAMQIKFLDEEYCWQFLYEYGADPQADWNKTRLQVKFEKFFWDVIIEMWEGRHVTEKFCIEIKPTMGDDYPSVYRQIIERSPGWHGVPRCLVLGEYTGIGATFEQVERFFQQGDISIILAKNIEQFLNKPTEWPIPCDTRKQLPPRPHDDFSC